MKKFKKLILVLITCLVILSFTGCGSNLRERAFRNNSYHFDEESDIENFYLVPMALEKEVFIKYSPSEKKYYISGISDKTVFTTEFDLYIMYEDVACCNVLLQFNSHDYYFFNVSVGMEIKSQKK